MTKPSGEPYKTTWSLGYLMARVNAGKVWSDKWPKDDIVPTIEELGLPKESPLIPIQLRSAFIGGWHTASDRQHHLRLSHANMWLAGTWLRYGGSMI